MKEKLKNIFIFLIPAIVGLVSTLFMNKDFFDTVNQPSFAPPKILFPIVWTILYLLMGVSLYRMYKINKKKTLIFGIQLALNMLWVILFFGFNLFLVSFIELIILNIVIIYIILDYYSYDKISSLVLVPYLLWSCFASYLNWAIFLLN